MTEEQSKFLDSFVEKRDTLSLEVGFLTQEKEVLLNKNQELSILNTELQQSIDNMRLISSKIGFEESEKVSKFRQEACTLEEEIKALKSIKESLSKDIEEKNSTILNLGLMIKSIQVSTADTVQSIKNMSTDLSVYTNKAKEATSKVEHEAGRIKKFTDELANVIDKERKINHEKTREIDAREIAVINREKMVELQYSRAVNATKN